MKTRRRILLFCLSTLCLTVCIGCEEETSNGQLREELTIEPLAGVGPVRFGMTGDQIIELLGPPDKTFAGKVTKLNYVPTRGLSFTVDAQVGLREIGFWSEGMLPSRVTTFAGKTQEGIGIGASQDAIVAAYGQPDNTGTDSRGIIQNLHYDELGAKFSLKDGKLMSMTLKAAE